MNHFKSVIFLLLLFSCSLYTYWLSTKDYVWIVPYMSDRAPAALRESREFQDIIEKPMRVFKRETVSASIDLKMHAGQKLFSMGQFSVSTPQGQNLICLEYPYVKLAFYAEGAAISGRRTQLSIKAPCRIHPQNHDLMSDIPVPLDEVYRRPAQSQEFHWPTPSMDVDVQVQDIYGDWPQLWELERVEFYKEVTGEGEKIVLSKQEFLQKIGSPLFIK